MGGAHTDEQGSGLATARAQLQSLFRGLRAQVSLSALEEELLEYLVARGGDAEAACAACVGARDERELEAVLQQLRVSTAETRLQVAQASASYLDSFHKVYTPAYARARA